jgi:3-methyladenine DNA glycosylase AlkC
MKKEKAATYSHLLTRKGATRTADVPVEVLNALNCGALSTVNLTEWLCVDNRQLLLHAFSAAAHPELFEAVDTQLAAHKKPTVNTVQQHIGAALRETATSDREKAKRFALLTNHPSDSVRCWAAYFAGHDPTTTLEEKLTAIRPLAADTHFGVREVAWLAVRTALAEELDATLQLLAPWVSDADANIRRFASEATRPRGVWCSHINALKTEPQRALHLLEPLRSDSSEYVRNSVANWLNDASKTQPNWVKTICERWLKESPTKETQLLVKRALRNLL